MLLAVVFELVDAAEDFGHEGGAYRTPYSQHRGKQ